MTTGEEITGMVGVELGEDATAAGQDVTARPARPGRLGRLPNARGGLLSVDQVAGELGVSPEMVMGWTRLRQGFGGLAAIDLGNPRTGVRRYRILRIRRADLNAFLAARQLKAADQAGRARRRAPERTRDYPRIV